MKDKKYKSFLKKIKKLKEKNKKRKIRLKILANRIYKEIKLL
jgi:hypothetical protein